MAKKQFSIGDTSRRFLAALDAFQAFKNQLFTAVAEEYGEDEAEQLHGKNRQFYDGIETSIMELLRVQFTERMGTGDDSITI